MGFLVAQKTLPAMRETWVQSLGWEDALEREWLPTPVFLPGEFHAMDYNSDLLSCALRDTGGTSGKEPTYQCRRRKRCKFDPWVRKIPWRRAWQPTPTFLPGEALGQRSPMGYSP